MVPDRTGRSLLGCILAGGLSSRMGQDKAGLVWEGRTLLDRTYHTVCRVVPQCIVVTRDRQYAGYPCVSERADRIGPVGGLIRGLEEAECRGCDGILAVACDMPCLEEGVLGQLLPGCEDASNVLEILFCRMPQDPCEHDEYHEQNLVAVYRVQSLPFLRHAVRNQIYSVKECIPTEYKKYIWYTEEQERYFCNVNTRQEYDTLCRYTTV